MSRVIVAAADGTSHNYPGGTGANYDEHGFLVIVTGEDPDAVAMAVWAPGHWARADLIRDGGPTDTQEPIP